MSCWEVENVTTGDVKTCRGYDRKSQWLWGSGQQYLRCGATGRLLGTQRECTFHVGMAHLKSAT